MRFHGLHLLSAVPLLMLCVAAAANTDSGTAASNTVQIPSPSPWRAFDGQFYRLEADGNFSCYSEDGINCKRGDPLSDPTRIQPLVCGLDHEAKYGITGYDTVGHWCNVAHANRFATWRNYGILAKALLLSANANGDPMCLSTDNAHCLVSDDRQPPPAGATVRPLVCGKAYESIWGITGYEPSNPDHWCQTREIVSQSFSPTGQPAPGSDDIAYTLDAVDLLAEDQPSWLLRLSYAPDALVRFSMKLNNDERWQIRSLAPPLADDKMIVDLDISADDTFQAYQATGGWDIRALRNVVRRTDPGNSHVDVPLPAQSDWPNSRVVVRVDGSSGSFLGEAVLTRRRPAPRIPPTGDTGSFNQVPSR